ncbi:TorF family putative porin [Paracidovorax oryzae]|uniref:TorF family putative porin n=1 Tax=Paracidovorax oryzae TaxID=862720 RepID=UPI0004797E35|nr:TorF family putative porin [Paracidovorax oryzae]
MRSTLLPLAALGAFGALYGGAAAAAQADETASYAVETEVKLVSDQRTRGISDSVMRPGAQLSVQVAHESGLVAQAQFSTVSSKAYTGSDGYNLLLGAGWRFGDPDGWHFGAGLATEFFPGARFSAPHAIDPDAGAPTDFRTTRYDTSYAVLEIGWGALEGRILNVISKTYRGADTGGVCGQILSVSADPARALECYARGEQNSRGSWLFDLDYRIALDAQTTLKLHAGTQKIRHFKEVDFSDYSVGILHRRWGFDWSAEYVMPRTRVREMFQVMDGDRLRATDGNRLVLAVSRKF